MGTNYYWYAKPDCPHCGRNDKPLHIGKSSGGWCFQLHVMGPTDYDDDIPPPRDFKGWVELFRRPGSIIRDEYDERVTVDAMLAVIKRKAFKGDKATLRRRVIDGVHCIGHGPGPWDLIVGEFS